jgi:uncharacterized 2Fe-2S/4Fe-4S cluster protein (DUF4445 family)
MAALSILFHPDKVSAAAPPGATVLEAAAAAGLVLHAPCGGQGRCGKCAVRFLSVAQEPSAAERKFFTPEQLRDGWRLACGTKLTADAEILLPPGAVVVEHRIMVEGVGREIVVEPNVRKLALQLPPPSVDDPRADLPRLLDALGAQTRPPARLDVLQSLPGILRGAGFHATAVLAADELVAIEPGDTSDRCYGVAVDVGTTTVVAYLCHLPTGKLLATASDLNPQAQYGEDVISRLRVATTEPDGRERLNQAVVGVVNQLIAEAGKQAGVSPRHVYEVAVVGNTCMTHLLLGVPASGLTALPFVPSFRSAQSVRAEDLGVSVHPEGEVYVAPNIGGFVGADTVGVILASELDHADGLRVAVDIGTNGEIVVAKDGRLYACSTAAGPAFEGARIAQGMRAAAGAIDQVEIGEDVAYHVLGDTLPRGLCGSGLVDLVAGLVRQGVVNESGRLLPLEEATSAPEGLRRRLLRDASGVAFVIAAAEGSALGRPVCLTARDVRELQLAKGAIFAGITMLLSRLGHSPGEVEELLLAGAFGNYIRRESAVAIGLLPFLPLERIHPIGNAAGLGARLMLSSVSLRRRAEEIAGRVEHIELSQQEGFGDRFAEAMALRPSPRGQ